MFFNDIENNLVTEVGAQDSIHPNNVDATSVN
jgi:hypothetical protein